ncbi:hypothetical protein P0X85_07535 [Defluviimonas nitratireducens]|nr:hypothetical protein [Defluviimonas nitratireducens]MDF1620363.1 hypothetical protein [Defluviimonas nitratireducens]
MQQPRSFARLFAFVAHHERQHCCLFVPRGTRHRSPVPVGSVPGGLGLVLRGTTGFGFDLALQGGHGGHDERWIISLTRIFQPRADGVWQQCHRDLISTSLFDFVAHDFAEQGASPVRFFPFPRDSLVQAVQNALPNMPHSPPNCSISAAPIAAIGPRRTTRPLHLAVYL